MKNLTKVFHSQQTLKPSKEIQVQCVVGKKKFFKCYFFSPFHCGAGKFPLRNHIQSRDNARKMNLPEERTSLTKLPFQNRRTDFSFIGKLSASLNGELKASLCLKRI